MISLTLILITVSNWLANALVVGTFLSMVEQYGNADTFSIYTVICVVGVAWIYFFIPETKLLDAITIRVRYYDKLVKTDYILHDKSHDTLYDISFDLLHGYLMTSVYTSDIVIFIHTHSLTHLFNTTQREMQTRFRTCISPFYAGGSCCRRNNTYMGLRGWLTGFQYGSGNDESKLPSFI